MRVSSTLTHILLRAYPASYSLSSSFNHPTTLAPYITPLQLSVDGQNTYFYLFNRLIHFVDDILK